MLSRAGCEHRDKHLASKKKLGSNYKPSEGRIVTASEMIKANPRKSLKDIGF